MTGATGFIGNYVVQELLKKNCLVIASSCNEEKARTKLWFGKVRYVPLDFGTIDESRNYFEKFEQPEHIIHLAWEGLPNYKSLFHFEKVLPSQYTFLKNLIINGAGSVTVSGTCFEYGMQEGCLSEHYIPQPANPYALAKNTLRLYLEELQKQHPFLLKWVRLFYMYGTGQNPKSLLAQLDSALDSGEKTFNMSGGEQVRDYLPVEKVAENIVAIALQENIGGIINCCSGEGVAVKELVQQYLIKKKKSIKLNLGFYPYPDYEPTAFWGDNNKLKLIIKQ